MSGGGSLVLRGHGRHHETVARQESYSCDACLVQGHSTGAGEMPEANPHDASWPVQMDTDATLRAAGAACRRRASRVRRWR
jgi:hypothetical protein